jgi:hypothetical protein
MFVCVSACVRVLGCVLKNVGKISLPWQCKMDLNHFEPLVYLLFHFWG